MSLRNGLVWVDTLEEGIEDRRGDVSFTSSPVVELMIGRSLIVVFASLLLLSEAWGK